jgi:hypothetical protein
VRSSSPAAARTNEHSRRDVSEGWCCTFVARGANEAAGAPGNKAQESGGARKSAGLQRSGAATKLASKHYTLSSVVLRGTNKARNRWRPAIPGPLGGRYWD